MNITTLKELEQESRQRGIPIVGSVKGQWLLGMVENIKPANILELGTANGYSGCILGSTGARLTTLEINEKMAEEARQNFSKYNIKATVLVGDAVLLVKQLSEKYDLIFIDFAKKKYIDVLEDCLRLVQRGGYIVADNISMDGCRDFKEAVQHHPLLETEIITIQDGLSCSKKR